MKEIFKDVKGYEGLYKVSNLGRVGSMHKRKRIPFTVRIMTLQLHPSGYYVVGLKRDGKRKTTKVHRLVAEAFIPNPDNKPQVNHKDAVKLNNTVENLEWVTPRENIRHAFRLGRMPSRMGEHGNKAVFTNEQVRNIRKMAKAIMYKDIGAIYRVDPATISRLVRKVTYKNA